MFLLKNDSLKNFYNVKELATLLGVSKSLLYEQVYRGSIPVRRIGRRILIPQSYVEKITKE